MAASLDDFLTSLKNISTALSSLSSTWRRGQGNQTTVAIANPYTVVAVPGRLVSVSVLVAGSVPGNAYNGTLNGLTDGMNFMVMPNVVGVYPAGLEFTRGLTIIPGTGQTVAVTFFTGT